MKNKRKRRQLRGKIVQHFLGICGFAISGLIIKICGFVISRLALVPKKFADLRLRKWNVPKSLRIFDLRTLESRVACPPLTFTVHKPYVIPAGKQVVCREWGGNPGEKLATFCAQCFFVCKSASPALLKNSYTNVFWCLRRKME